MKNVTHWQVEIKRCKLINKVFLTLCLTCTSQSPNPLCKQLNSMEINRKMNFDNPKRLKQPCSLWLMFVLYIFRTNTFPTSSTGNRTRQVVQSLNWFLRMTLFHKRERNEASCFGEALISFSGSQSKRFHFARKALFSISRQHLVPCETAEKLFHSRLFVSQMIKAVSYVHQIIIRSPVPKKIYRYFHNNESNVAVYILFSSKILC